MKNLVVILALALPLFAQANVPETYAGNAPQQHADSLFCKADTNGYVALPCMLSCKVLDQELGTTAEYPCIMSIDPRSAAFLLYRVYKDGYPFMQVLQSRLNGTLETLPYIEWR